MITMESIFSNLNMFILMEIILLIFFILAIVIPAVNRCNILLEKRKGVTAKSQVNRGEQSMNNLHIFYGVATFLYITVIQMTSDLDKIKIALILVNYCLLTFLFYFSSWFRNSLFFRFVGRIQKD